MRYACKAKNHVIFGLIVGRVRFKSTRPGAYRYSLQNAVRTQIVQVTTQNTFKKSQMMKTNRAWLAELREGLKSMLVFALF